MTRVVSSTLANRWTDSFDAQQASVGLKADLPQGGQIAQQATAAEGASC